MKPNLVLIMSVFLDSIFAQNINRDFKSSIAQDWNKRGKNANLQNEAAKEKLFGYECKGSVKAKFIRWKWAWSGEWRCPGLTSIIGYSTDYNNKKSALENALSDFMFKFTRACVVNLEKFKPPTFHAKSTIFKKMVKFKQLNK